VVPILARSFDRAEPFAAGGFGRDRRVVDQRVQFAMQPALGLGDRLFGVFRIGEIDLDVILRARLPRTILWKGMPRTGDDAPAGGGKTLHCGVANAATCSSEEERAARVVGCRRHVIYRAPFSLVMRGLDPRIHADAAQTSVFAKAPW
jgi:hypothetical protein